MSVPVAVSGDGNIADCANMGMRGGLLNRFRLNDAWAINLDLRFDVLETTVSNEGNHGKAFSALVGVTYKFKDRGWKSPEIPVVAPVVGKYSDAEGDALVAQLRDANRKNDDPCKHHGGKKDRRADQERKRKDDRAKSKRNQDRKQEDPGKDRKQDPAGSPSPAGPFPYGHRAWGRLSEAIRPGDGDGLPGVISPGGGR